MRLSQTAQAAGCAIALIAGCAQVNPQRDYDAATQEIEAALGRSLDADWMDDAAVQARVASLLSDGISADEAVELALLNNPRLRAALLTIGVGRAAVVQAALLANPEVSFSLRWPDGGGLTNLEMGIAQNIAELWQLPLRREVAERELDRTIFEVARQASVTALDARSAHIRALRAERQRELAQQNLEVVARLLERIQERRAAGLVNDLDVNLATAQHVEAQVELRSAQFATIEARAALATLLGLSTPPAELRITGALAETIQAPSAGAVIAAGREARLDVRAVALAVQAAAQRVALERSRFLRSLELGVSVERSERARRGDRDWLAETAWASAEAGGLTPPSFQPREKLTTDWVVGPTLGVSLPIFDQNQAQIARAQLEYRQAALALTALDRELTQEAHTAVERLRAATDNARFFREQALPPAERAFSMAENAYTQKMVPLFSVVETQRTLLKARAGYIAALAEVALAEVALERAAGRPLAQLRAAATSQPRSGGERDPVAQ